MLISQYNYHRAVDHQHFSDLLIMYCNPHTFQKKSDSINIPHLTKKAVVIRTYPHPKAGSCLNLKVLRGSS